MFCLYLNYGLAQDLKINLQHITTEQKMLKGSIDDKYDISVYLKYYKLSDDNLAIYSVKGWYYYDKVKKKIPLVGVYDGALTLFSTKGKDRQDKILDFDYGGTTYEVLDTIQSIKDYDEKFVYSVDDASAGEWTDGKKKLKLKFYTNDVSVSNGGEFLNINYKKGEFGISLSDILQSQSGFDLIGYNKTQNEIRILLTYEYNSRPNVQGMCGAGQEIGYVILIYDLNFNLINIEDLETESCLNGIYSEEIKSNLKNIKKLKITDDNNKSKIVTIDEKLIQIKTE